MLTPRLSWNPCPLGRGGGQSHSYPFKYIVWKKKKNVKSISTDLSLKDVREKTIQEEYLSEPLGGYKEEQEFQYPWITVKNEQELTFYRKILGKSMYSSHEGINTRGANGVYWLKILNQKGNLVLIENLAERSKRKVKRVRKWVEKDLVYPLVLTSNIDKWYYNYSYYIVIPHDTNGRLINENYLKINYPETYKYLYEFKSILANRKLHGKKIKENNWYILEGTNRGVFYPYKVVIPCIGERELRAVVLERVKDKYLGEKPLMIQETSIYIGLKDREEAHYLCAILNSKTIQEIISQIIIKGGKRAIGPGSLSVLNIPKFDKNKKEHIKLAKLSIEAHEAKRQKRLSFLKKIEDEINEIVKRIF